jgi:hypothetical protein
MPRHDNAVRGTSWDPDCALRGYDPRSLTRSHGHDSKGGVSELILGMEVFRDGMAVSELVDEGGDRGWELGAGVYGLSCLRHSLSQ